MFGALELTAMKWEVAFLCSESCNGFSKSFLHSGLWNIGRPPCYKDVHSFSLCVYMCVSVCVFECARACERVHIRVCVYVSVYHIYIYILRLHTHTHTDIYIYIYVYIDRLSARKI
jgi:hypothetical protein